jgi:solute carrier family 8 (sodium/calcium exchanger)
VYSDIVILPSRPLPLGMKLRRRCTSGGGDCKRHLATWYQQLSTAFFCGGGPSEQAGAGSKDWFFHCVALSWKVLFAFVPPASVFGGWACFIVSLGMIGGVTALAGDLANLFGCCVGIPPDICGYTLVALGTSLPDTFASRLAATQDDTADNAIGNITGSNSVNVFLGLGIPWTWAALYWQKEGITSKWRNHTWKGQRYEDAFPSIYQAGGGFIVPQGSLSFSVPIFTACALICIGLLFFRRWKYGGELGGSKEAQARDAGFLILLWVVFCGASAVKSLTTT